MRSSEMENSMVSVFEDTLNRYRAAAEASLPDGQKDPIRDGSCFVVDYLLLDSTR